MSRKKNKKCIVCGCPSVGRVCREHYESRSNKGHYTRMNAPILPKKNKTKQTKKLITDFDFESERIDE